MDKNRAAGAKHEIQGAVKELAGSIERKARYGAEAKHALLSRSGS